MHRNLASGNCPLLGEAGNSIQPVFFSVSPQSRSLFSASLHTFCLTARAYLNTQKYGLICSLKLLGHHLVKLQKMFLGKEFWQSLACFVIGGIITVILIKMLERQRDQNNEEQGNRRILIPVQEVGDDLREVESGKSCTDPYNQH